MSVSRGLWETRDQLTLHGQIFAWRDVDRVPSGVVRVNHAQEPAWVEGWQYCSSGVSMQSVVRSVLPSLGTDHQGQGLRG